MTDERAKADGKNGEAEYFRQIVVNLTDVVWAADLDLNTTYVSPSVERLLGFPPERYARLSVAERFPEDARQRIKALYAEELGNEQDPAVDRDRSRIIELELYRADGTTVPVSSNVRFIRDGGGKPAGVQGVVRDITDRRRAEEELRESEEKFRNLAQTTSTGIMIYQDDKWVYANPAAIEISGYSAEELYAMKFWEIVAPEFADKVRETGRMRQQNIRTVQDYEFMILTRDGQERWVYLEGTTTEYKGRPAGLISVMDITDRRRAEEELRESEQRYRNIFKYSPLGVAHFGRDGRITDCNDRFEEIIGAPRAKLVGANLLTIANERIIECVRNSLRGATTYYEGPYHSVLSGKDLDLRLVYSAIFSADGEVIGGTGIMEDVTERKRAEEERGRLQTQLNQAQRMESVGRLAGGVAHDFNNMLGVILGRTEMALLMMDPGDPVYNDLREIRRAGERSANLTRQLLAFARKQTVAPRVIDLNETVASMLAMLQRIIGEDISLRWRPAVSLAPVRIDPTQIDQVLANLCVNARDAIGQTGGAITIETGDVTLGEADCADHAGFVPGEYVMLAVSDDGCGMDGEVMANIFEPFFTTKGVGEGTGLGLATVYGIVKQNNGLIGVSSEPGRGTTFKVYLPRPAAALLPAAEQTETAPPCGSETVLVVEDEPSILELTHKMLESLGYRVLTAATPGDAIQMAQAHARDIQLVMTDVIMPEMNGRDLAERLTGLCPGLRCLFMSGYPANVIASQGILDEGVAFIQKPFLMKDLAGRVREVLSPRS